MRLYFFILITLISLEIVQKNFLKFLSRSCLFPIITLESSLDKENSCGIQFVCFLHVSNVSISVCVYFQIVHEPGGAQRVLEKGPVHSG